MLPDGTLVRRATVDDLDALRGLWREARLPDYELERRLTEFQVAVDGQGWILGALGVRFSGQHAQVHSLALRRADLASELLATLWERVLNIIQHQGSHRVWLRESGPGWAEAGFTQATSSERQTLPQGFGQPEEPWFTRHLRDDPLKLIAAEEQLEAYLELERLKTERLMRRGQMLKIAATAFAGLLFVLAMGVLFFTVRRSRRTPPRR